MNKISSQIQKHMVALISLFLAIASLTYNTWRNEETEYNRNIRFAGFEVILKIGELQRVVLHSHYGKQALDDNARNGWVYVQQIQDLALVMPAPMPAITEQLKQTWQQNWEELGSDQVSVDKINQAIDTLREQTLATLRTLD